MKDSLLSERDVKDCAEGCLKVRSGAVWVRFPTGSKTLVEQYGSLAF